MELALGFIPIMGANSCGIVCHIHNICLRLVRGIKCPITPRASFPPTCVNFLNMRSPYGWPAFNSAYHEHGGSEDKAFAIAWAAANKHTKEASKKKGRATRE